MQVKAEIEKLEACLRSHPQAYRKLKGYLEELRQRLAGESSDEWLAYQTDRLRRVRWLVDKNDDGRGCNMVLHIRPYDIVWMVYAIGMTADAAQARNYAEQAFNGVMENAEKALSSPQTGIVFTDKFADFCYLCSGLTAGELFDRCVERVPEPKAFESVELGESHWPLYRKGIELWRTLRKSKDK